MKNIHLLPTEKPSRLSIVKNELVLFNTEGEGSMTQHIYITSDEEIKEGDWVYDTFKNACPIIRQLTTEEEVKEFQKTEYKIILTTDPDLIADGVQAISDEFLEWFVKNPNCESVEVKSESSRKFGMWKPECYPQIYKIIIPQEDLTKEEEDTFFVNHVCGIQDKPKQETVEDAAVKYAVSVNAKMGSHKGAYENCSRLDFIAGTKWESERGYNEQIALINWLQQSLTAKKFYSTDAEDLIEQFKRK